MSPVVFVCCKLCDKKLFENEGIVINKDNKSYTLSLHPENRFATALDLYLFNDLIEIIYDDYTLFQISVFDNTE